MTDVLKHRFISGKLDGADTQQVQPSHWNDGHKFIGGAAGDVLTRDPTDAAFGAIWMPGGAARVVTTTATGTVHNLPMGPVAAVTYLRCANAADLSITGLAFDAVPRDGDRVFMQTRNSGRVYLVQDSPSSTYKFANIATTAPTPLQGGSLGRATYVYEAATGYWILHHHQQGSPIPIPFNAANYTGQGAITAAMVKLHDYYLNGATVLGSVVIDALPGNTAGNTLTIGGWPFGLFNGRPARYSAGIGTINGPWGPIMTSFAGPLLSVLRFDFGNWTAGPHYINVQTTWETQ